jgi:hypothetical protein
MSIGPLAGLGASVAGTPLAQTRGADVERTQQESGNQQRRVENQQKAENAAGIGETDGDDHETAERDADGRRLWEETPQPDGPQAAGGTASGDSSQSKDATGQSGSLLDLTG